jgi:hypothetical protein
MKKLDKTQEKLAGLPLALSVGAYFLPILPILESFLVFVKYFNFAE